MRCRQGLKLGVPRSSVRDSIQPDAGDTSAVVAVKVLQQNDSYDGSSKSKSSREDNVSSNSSSSNSDNSDGDADTTATAREAPRQKAAPKGYSPGPEPMPQARFIPEPEPGLSLKPDCDLCPADSDCGGGGTPRGGCFCAGGQT